MSPPDVLEAAFIASLLRLSGRLFDDDELLIHDPMLWSIGRFPEDLLEAPEKVRAAIEAAGRVLPTDRADLERAHHALRAKLRLRRIDEQLTMVAKRAVDFDGADIGPLVHERIRLLGERKRIISEYMR